MTKLIQQVNKIFLNVKDYSAQGDGVTDDSAAITAAINAVNNAGGGVVYFPPGTYVTGKQFLYSKVHLWGAGIEATIIQLKNGTNDDLLAGSINGYGGGVMTNMSAGSDTGAVGGIYNWSVQDLTLDGNKSNQSSGTSYCIHQYGFGFILHNVRVRNGYSGGILSDWNGGGTSGADSMEAQVTNLKVHGCNGIGVEWGGPHDSQFVNVLIFQNGSHCLHIAPNAIALSFLNTHLWGPQTGNSSVCLLLEAGFCTFINCDAEGSDTVNVVALASEWQWIGGNIFGAGTYSVTGIQFGQQAGNTPYASSTNQSGGLTTAVVCGGNKVDATFTHNEGSNGALWFSNDGGNNQVRAVFYQTAGTLVTGTLSGSTQLQTSQNGLTPDGTIGKGGIFKNPLKANQAFLLTDTVTDIFSVNTNSKRVEIPNGTDLKGYSDNYSTNTYDFGATTAQFNILTKIAKALAQAFLVTDGTTELFNINTSVKKVDLPNGTELRGYTDAYTTTTFDITTTLAQFNMLLKIVKSLAQAFIVNDGTSDVFNVNTASKRVELPNAAELKAYSDNYSTATYDITSTLALFNIAAKIAKSASSAFVATDGTLDLFNVNTSSKRVELPNAAELKAYSDAYSTTTYDITSTLALFNIAAKIAKSASQAFIVNDGTNDVTNTNTSSKRFELVNGTSLKAYSDAYSTATLELTGDANGTIKLANDANATLARRASGIVAFGGSIALTQGTVQVVATSDTVTMSNGIGVVRLNPAGNVTGIKLVAGSFGGQCLHVINESAFTITFDVSGNSFVADGVSAVLAASRMFCLVWDNSTNLWYRTA